MVIIRPSSLMTYLDCSRRSAVSLFSKDIEAAGFGLHPEQKSIAAIVGTSVHAGAAFSLTQKLNTGDIGLQDDAEQAAHQTFDNELSERGALYDNTTQNRNAASLQILRMVRSYRQHVAPLVSPVAVEKTFKANIPNAPGYVLRGTLDLAENETVEDLKTGIQRRQNAAQYGAYSLLRRAHGHEVTRIQETFIKRGTNRGALPIPVRVEVKVETAETMAHYVIERIIMDHQRFIETGNPWSFLPNPGSMLCTPVYCRAWGTRFCTAHKWE